jgi:hypothetical protein
MNTDKIFYFSRAAGKQTKMLEAVIKFTESNKGCGAFVLMTADEANRLSGLEKWNPIIGRLIHKCETFERAKGIEHGTYLLNIHKENAQLTAKLKVAKKSLKDLLPFMNCLAFDNNLVRTFNFEQISKNISETISILDGELNQ